MSGPFVPRVLLIGMMGVGKSTTGKRLAAALGWDYKDSDEAVLARTGRTIPQIFAEDGEAAFRREEAAVLAEAAASAEPAVVSVAGGAVLAEANRPVIRGAGLVVWLRARDETIIARVGDGRTRPLLAPDPAAAVRRLSPLRRPVYEELAEVTVDVDDRRPDAVVRELEPLVRAWMAERRSA